MKMLINGKNVATTSGAVIEVLNPSTGKIVDTIPDGTPQDVDQAVSAAKAAQKEWAKVPLWKRGEILYKFLQLVETNKTQLASLLSQESGKPITEATGEIGNVPIAFSACIEKAKHLYGAVIPAGGEQNQETTIQFTVHEPLGVVAAIIPFNFPVDLFGQKVPPALMAGNAVIVKPPQDNPLTLLTLGGLLQEAGVPAGVIQIVTGRGENVGAALVAHPGVNAISFTGSTKVGIANMESAAKNLTPVMLELGGNDAFIVLEDADIDLAVEETVWGRMYNAGQVCCASKRFLVHNAVKAEFTAKLKARLEKIKVGATEKADTQMGCLISEHAAKGVEAQVKQTIGEGATLLIGGTRNGAYYSPTILTNVTKTMAVAKDMEIFGPVVPIIGFDSLDEAVEIANASIFGLCGCVFTSNMKKAFQVAYRLECGGAVINGASFFRSFEMPFGGYKFSGLGNEGIMTTLEEVTHTKTVVLKNILG
ncbi:MAG TPA: aldehyde dehydrogenase family protein [Negativicutes bacterium]|nr:aldehyde dehydrogenase family protein [Negativicutes bacterium]